MCDLCDAAAFDRRRFLRRAAGAAAAGGAVIAGGVVLPEAAGAATAATPASHELPLKATSTARRPTGVSAPRIVTRAQWGADESIRTSQRAFAPIRKLIVHHTASPTNPRDPVAWVRKTYEFHVLGRGYSDVGYNFLIDQHGVIYEGRWARNYGPGQVHDGENAQGLGVVGGHALNRNTGTCGICMIGDFTTGRPTAAALASLTQLLAWKCARHHIDPMGNDLYVSLTGERLTFPNICGHKDVGITICPGPNVFNHFPAIRQTIRKMVGSFPPQTVNLQSAVRYNYAHAAGSTKGSGSPSLLGYRILTNGGQVVGVGRAAPARSPRDEGATDAIALAAVPGTKGYLALDRRGGVLAFGGATWYGSLRSRSNHQTPVDIAPTRSANGYWILAANGGVFAHGGAVWFGSLSSMSGKVVPRKIRATPTSRGYWILTADGRVWRFGDAVKAGSPADHRRHDVVDLAPTVTGKGYWVLLSDGSVMSFGDARPLGDLHGRRRRSAVTAILASPSGKGYYILSGDGTVASFGKIAAFGGVRTSGRLALSIAPVIA